MYFLLKLRILNTFCSEPAIGKKISLQVEIVITLKNQSNNQYQYPLRHQIFDVHGWILKHHKFCDVYEGFYSHIPINV